MVRAATLTTAAIIPKSRPPCQFRLWQGGFFLTKIRLRKFKKLPEKSRGAFYFAEYARKHADFVGTTLLENLPRAGTGPRSGLDLGQRPSPLRAPVQSFALFLLIFHHRRKFFYGFRNSFLFLRTPLRNPKKTLDPRSLPYFRHFFPIHVG